MDLFQKLRNYLGGFLQSAGREAQQLPQQVGHAVQNVAQAAAPMIQHSNPVIDMAVNSVRNFQQTDPNVGFGNQLLISLPQAPDIRPVFNAIPQLNLPKFNIQNPVGNFAANLPGNLAEGIVNTPRSSFLAANDLGNDVAQTAMGTSFVTPQQAIAHAAGAAELPLLVGSFGLAGAGKELIKQPFKQAVFQGAKTGAGWGAGFGGLQGLEANGNAPDIETQLMNGFQGAAIGGIAGGVLGGGVPIATKLGGKLIDSLKTPEVQNEAGGFQLGPKSAPQLNAQVFNSPEVQQAYQTTLQNMPTKMQDKFTEKYVTAINSGDFRGALSLVASGLPPETRNALMSQVIKADDQGIGMLLKEADNQTGGINPNAPVEVPSLKSVVEPPITKQRGFIETIKNSPNTAPEVAKDVTGRYSPITNTATLEEARALLKSSPNDATALVYAKSAPTAKTYAVAQELVRKYQAEGNFAQAIDVVETVSKKATTQGQAIQALSLWNRLTPEGALKYSQGLIDRANEGKAAGSMAKLSPEQASKITDLAKQAGELPEGRAKVVKTAELVEAMHEVVPAGLLKKIDTIQTMAQLLNPKTAIRNVVGNFGFQLGENVSKAVATPIDMATSLFTGKRSVTLPSIGAQTKGFSLGLKEGAEDALKGVNTSGITSQFDLPATRTFKDPILGTLEKGLNLELRATDRAFYRSAVEESLNNQMRVAKVNGESLTAPTEEMINKAHLDGLYRTFQDDNVATKVFTNIKKGLNLGQDFGLGSIVLKYPKTPASLIMRGIDYSPAGFFNPLIQVAKPLFGKEFNQKAFVEGFARAFTGTSGLVATGAVLHKLGIITGHPEQDKDIDAVQQVQGLGRYKINISSLKRFVLSGFNPNEAGTRIGDKNVTYDWFQPFAVALSMGANIDDNNGKLKPGSVIDTMLSSVQGGVETIFEQPLVTGLTNLTKGYNLVDSFAKTLESIPASFTPGIVSQVNQLTDNTSRNTYDPTNTGRATNLVKSRIPGLSQTLPANYDIVGNEKKRMEDNNWFNVFLNPAFVTTVKDNPALKEVMDIYDRSGETQQAPRVAPRSVTINGDNMKLSGEQISEYQQYIGTKAQSAYDKLLNDPKFGHLSDEDKAKMMANILTDINTAAKIELFGNHPKTVSANAKSFLGGNGSVISPKDVTASPKGTTGLGVYQYIDDGGSQKTVDLSTPIEQPGATGDDTFDKLQTSKYNSEISSRINNIYKLYQDNQIDKDAAIKAIKDLTQQKITKAKSKLTVAKKIATAFAPKKSAGVKMDFGSMFKAAKSGSKFSVVSKAKVPSLKYSTSKLSFKPKRITIHV